MLLLNEAARQWEEYYRARRSYSTVTIPAGVGPPDARAFWNLVFERIEAAEQSMVRALSEQLYRLPTWAEASFPARPAHPPPQFTG